jgi:hypothetical protein
MTFLRSNWPVFRSQWFSHERWPTLSVTDRHSHIARSTVIVYAVINVCYRMHACVDKHANKSLVTLFILFACAGTAEDSQVKRLRPERPVFDYRQELYVSRRHAKKTGFVAHADSVPH